MNSKPLLSTQEFELLRTYIQNISGICLDDSKTILMECRLSPLLERHNCNSYMDLYQKAQYIEGLNSDICSAISTNETSFFRDHSVFEMIQDDFIPHFLNQSNSLQIFSAASSTGQESYSLSMILNETISHIHKYDIKIEGTDISNEAVAYASYGLYTQMEISRGIGTERLLKHFDLQEKSYRVKDEVRYLTHFRELNLLKSIPFGAQFDIILCRNIAIYFDRETKHRLFNELAKCLKPGGRLVIGSTETLWQVTDVFDRQEYKGVVYYTLAENSH